MKHLFFITKKKITLFDEIYSIIKAFSFMFISNHRFISSIYFFILKNIKNYFEYRKHKKISKFQYFRYKKAQENLAKKFRRKVNIAVGKKSLVGIDFANYNYIVAKKHHDYRMDIFGGFANNVPKNSEYCINKLSSINTYCKKKIKKKIKYSMLNLPLVFMILGLAFSLFPTFFDVKNDYTIAIENINTEDFFSEKINSGMYTFNNGLSTVSQQQYKVDFTKYNEWKAEQDYMITVKKRAEALTAMYNYQWSSAPLKNYTEYMVLMADKYNIDWRIVASISIVESGGGKHCYRPYNAWGWGGQKSAYTFSDFKNGIEIVTIGLSKGYFSRGADTPFEIEPSYCPPCAASGNGWAKKITWIYGIIDSYYK